MREEVAGSELTKKKAADQLLAPGGRLSAQVTVRSRLGVWGLVGGFGAMTAFTLGAPIPLGAAIAVMGGGVLLSGLGTLLASTAVLRRGGGVPSAIRTAALAGVPLGTVLGLLGMTSLTRWGPLVAIVNALTPTAGVLGILVIVLLVVGFFVGLPTDGDDDQAPA